MMGSLLLLGARESLMAKCALVPSQAILDLIINMVSGFRGKTGVRVMNRHETLQIELHLSWSILFIKCIPHHGIVLEISHPNFTFSPVFHQFSDS